jgi:CoA:oxalate CoA-transferase
MAMLNSNKKSLALDLKNPAGREVFGRLVDRGDVLIENFAPGAMDKLGLGPAALRARNPRLVYAAGSGYGQTGRDAGNLAMDVTVQAASGILHCTGFPDGPPVKCGPAVVDFLGGAHLYGAIVTALFERERTGRGRAVEVAMQDAAYPALASNLGMFFGPDREKVPPRTGNRHGGLSLAPYNVYRAADGWVALICVTEEHWRGLLRAMGREDLLEDPRFATNAARAVHMAEVDRTVEDWMEGRSRAEAVAAAQRHGAPAAPVRDLEEVVNDLHLHERGMLRWVDHPEVGRVTLPSSPLRFEGAPAPELVPSSRHNADEAEVLGGMLGMGETEREALRAAGAIGSRLDAG